MLSLANERKVSDVKKIDLLEEITQVVKSNKARTHNNGSFSQQPDTIPNANPIPKPMLKPIQYDKQFTPKLPKNTPKPRYVAAKDTRGGTPPPGLVHLNV